jgi:hypothetical protein
MLSEYEMSGHITKHRFMLNYLVWQQHGEVQAAAPAELNKSDDEDQMDVMIGDVGMEYDLGSEISSYHRRCGISMGSLPLQRRKCTMALS